MRELSRITRSRGALWHSSRKSRASAGAPPDESVCAEGVGVAAVERYARSPSGHMKGPLEPASSQGNPMHEEDLAIVKGLVPVAWADGQFADKEKETLDALLDAFGATAEEKAQLIEYAKVKRSLDDINLQDLSAEDRRMLLQHAVLLTWVDGSQAAEEKAILDQLASRLKIPDEEARSIIEVATARVKSHLKLL
ncbi:MAG: TerB family tellurite resistance protein [Myxococcales bacterium]|nr:TerB family tellurite resistance protein [Myxococcales bacterium]